MNSASQPLTQAQELYYYLRLTRSLEDMLARLYRQGKVFGGLYSSLGQEAVSVGAACALESGDWMAPMIRNIGALLVRGIQPREILMQLMAREGSPTHGKDGTCHMADLTGRHIVAPMSMLGDLIPIMTGVAMAGRYLGHKIVAMTWIGDGGTSTGAFHEGMNLAAVQKAPLVVIVENNQWAYSTPVARQVPLRDLADRARAYGITNHIVDGNDVDAMLQVSRRAVAQARAGPGPDRSQDHAHERPRATRFRGIRPARDDGLLEGPRPARALSRLSDAERIMGSRRANLARCPRRRRTGARAGCGRSLTIPAAGKRRGWCVLRGLPQHRAALAAAQRRSDAAKIGHTSTVDHPGFRRLT
jgi:hypothetical protein